jgi:hypothetical protein
MKGAKRIYNAEGKELLQVSEIQNNDVLFVSLGDDFIK